MKDKYVLKTRICSVLLHVFLLLMVAIILLPVCWLVLNSLKTNQEMFLNSLALPKKWMFVNYATAWGKGLLFYFKNSIIVSAISILISIPPLCGGTNSDERFHFPLHCAIIVSRSYTTKHGRRSCRNLSRFKTAF